MPEDDDLQLDQLLARGRLSGRQYDEIGRRVLAQVAPKSRRWLWAATVPAATLASALVVGLVLSVRAPSGRSAEGLPRSASDGFTARGTSATSGEAPPPAVVLDVGCAGRPSHVCRVGDTLMFSVNGAETGGISMLVAVQFRPIVPVVRPAALAVTVHLRCALVLGAMSVIVGAG